MGIDQMGIDKVGIDKVGINLLNAVVNVVLNASAAHLEVTQLVATQYS